MKRQTGDTNRQHIGLNGQLLSLGGNYRSAGISSYIYGLLRHLPQVSDLRYTLWTGERGGELPGVARHVTPLPTERPLARILWEQLLQPYAVARLRPDLLHGLAFVLPLWLTVPGIITIYDLSFFRVPEAFRPLNRLYLQTMGRASARRAAHICAISEHGRADIVRFLGVPPEKVTVVYPGLDARFEAIPGAAEVAAFRAARGLPDRFVLYLGTLEPRKNVPALLRAFAALRAELPALHLVLAGGKGWGFEEIFAECERLALGDRVHFPGFVPASEQALWYGAAELFAYPSRYEGFGLPPLEAMACGTPVVTSDAASLTEVVGEAGITVPPEDEHALTDALRRLLTDPAERAERRARGLAQAARFRWEESARAQASIYRHVLGGAGDGKETGKGPA